MLLFLLSNLIQADVLGFMRDPNIVSRGKDVTGSSRYARNLERYLQYDLDQLLLRLGINLGYRTTTQRLNVFKQQP